MMNKNVRIPLWLCEFHGEEASVFSLLATYATGTILGLYAYLSASVPEGWRTWLICGLAIDIGGGVVANMSKSTTIYYAARPKLRWFFILLHLIHPFLLGLVYGESWILVVGATTLLFTATVNYLHGRENQRIVAGSLTLINFVIIYSLLENKLLLLLLTCYSVKLIVAFAIRWNDTTAALS